MEVLVFHRGGGNRSIVGQVCIVDKEESRFGVVTKVEVVEAARSRFELKNTIFGGNPKNAATIMAIVHDMIFLPELEQGKAIGNTGFIKIHPNVTKIGFFGGELGALVAVILNGVRCGADVGDMIGIAEEINHGLTVKEKEVLVDSLARAGGCDKIV